MDLTVKPLRLNCNIFFKANRPSNKDEVPAEINYKYSTPESREKTIAILGASVDSQELSPYTKQANSLARELVARGYNIVTGAGSAGIMGAANKGGHEAELNPENKNHGECLGLMTQEAWGNEDYRNCNIIKRAGDDFTRIADFDKVAKHIVAFPGGAMTVAEATSFIAKARYEKGDKKPDVSFIGPYQGLDFQYETLEKIKTLGTNRQTIYKSYNDVKSLLDEKFPNLK
ncbi:MAG: hypothetical protein WCG23_12775 [bacterium]